MYYSISFTYAEPDRPLFFTEDNRLYALNNARNTWIDWHLIPLERPSIAPPEVKTKIVEVPGMNGDLDFTESLTGYPVYKNREGDIEFMVETGHEDWNEVYQSMCSYLHGRKLYFALEDDPGYYYYGRITVDQYRSQKDNSKITIHYNTEPPKYDYCKGLNGDAWWDTFDFESDNLNSVNVSDLFNQFDVNDYDNYTDICRSETWGNFTEFPIIPTIQIVTPDVTDSVTLHFVNTELGIDFTKTFTRGTYVVPQMIFSQNKNTGKTFRKFLPLIGQVEDVKELRYIDMYGRNDMILEAKGNGLVTIFINPGRK